MATPPVTRAPQPQRIRLSLDDGARTTAHVIVHALTDTELRVERLPGLMQLEEWCRAQGVEEALVGGFYVRSPGSVDGPDVTGLPLGELRIEGTALPSVPFVEPWNARRACVHVENGTIRIARRDALPAEPAGALLQAGPLLVRDGEVVYRDGLDSEGFSAADGQFDSDITEGRHPRAAIGVAAGEIVALVADGRSDEDAGLTLGELAAAMADLGVIAAMNLDGGGSASLVCDGRLRNRPRESHGIDLAGGRAITTVIAFDAD